MKIFLSTCLFLAILSEVIALQCKVKKPNENTSTTCKTTKGGSCFTRLTYSNLNGSLEFESETGCIADCTSEDYGFTTKEGRYIQNFWECCQGIECLMKFNNRRTPQLNGKECPTCFPSLSEACKGSETIKCNNDETQCIEFVVAHDNSAIPDKNFYGCASPRFCELAKNSMHINPLSGTITRARCCGTLPSLEQLNFEG